MDINFNKNEDHNKLLLSNLKHKLAQVKLGGGQKKIDKMHAEGKMTARERINYLLDEKSKQYVYANVPTANLDKIVTPAKRVNEQILNHYSENYPNLSGQKLLNEFRSKNDRYIGLLAKEFEMRKAAKSFSKSKLSNTGDIDISKIYNYKIDDQIFRKIMRVPKGKSHGLVMLLDKSGSMYDNMAGTIEQLLILVSFCRKVNIPFVAYGFGDEVSVRNMDFPNDKVNVWDTCESVIIENHFKKSII
jgi:hypothetical protein